MEFTIPQQAKAPEMLLNETGMWRWFGLGYKASGREELEETGIE
jgi:hypothetical protein